MAAGTAQVLQEYLVKLGYTTDLISLRKFEDSLGSVGKRVFKLGGAVAGVVASVEAASAAFAYSMRKTYFASELANSSVKNMQALAYAGKQVGVSGEEMGSAIKGMAQAMRLNPGLQGLVESFGIKVTGRDTSDVMTDFVKALKDMPEFVGSQYAALFGMDPDTFHQLREHMDELIAKREEMLRLQKLAGLDLDAQKKTVLEYTSAMDKLSASFGVFTDSVLVRLAPLFKDATESMSTFFTRLAYSVGKGTLIVKGSLLDRLFGGGIELPEELKVKETLSHEDSELRKRWKGIPGGPGQAPAKGVPTPERAGQPQEATQAPAKASKTPAAETPPGSPATSAMPDQAVSNLVISELRRMGWSQPQAVGIAANLHRESSFNPKAVGDSGKAFGIAQWHPERQEDFRQWAKKPIQESSITEQLAFLDYELRQGKERGAGIRLAAAKTPEQAAEVVARHYERPANIENEVNLRTGLATRLGATTTSTVVTQTNNVEIKVSGQGATETARAVANAQSRVLGDATRMLKGAVQ